MTKENAIKTADEIMGYYALYGGSEYSGEKVSQLEHMVQTAQLAEDQGFDEDVILAAFLHDIGHIAVQISGDNHMGEYGTKDHEAIGSRLLNEKGFSKKICRLVESHVSAKRYLTLRESGYYEQLSEASKQTLGYQGGKMSDEEADRFELDPLLDEIVLMRKWDEQAKIENQPLPDLEKYREMMIRHLSNNTMQ